jgi:tetratricopeptide (TPR) repeat protein
LVIARNSSFAYKGQARDIRELATLLNAAYIVEGSVRRIGNSVRINAQLIEAATGHHVWADRYDGKLDDVFRLQDTITEKIVTALALTLSPEDREVLVRTDTTNMEAYENFLRGREIFLQFSRESTYRCRGSFTKALSLDADFGAAYAMLAWSYVFEYTNGWAENREQALDKALELASKAIELNDRLPVAYFAKGLVYRERREYVQALAEAQRSIEIDPNYANGYVLMATLLYYAGRPEEGLRMIEKASRLHPVHPSNYPFHRGQALFILKRYDEAIKAFEAGLKQNSSSQRLRVWLAATYAQIGRQDDAAWEANQVLMSDPNFSLKQLQQAFPFTDRKELDRVMGALRKAGFSGTL